MAVALIVVAMMACIVAGEVDVSSNPGLVNQVSYSGYLIDLYCYGLARAGGMGPDGSNVIKDPSQHSVHCLRDPSQCREGGYYMAAKDSVTGQYGIKFLFDDAGNQAALALLDSLPVLNPDGTKAFDGKPGMFTVTATGTINGDGILRNATLAQCLPAGSPQCDGVLTSTGSYSGYLIDLYCYGLALAGGTGPDGSNVIKDPSEHSVHCLRDPPQCREGGYYMALKDSVTGAYGIKFKFDDAGNQAALALLDSLPVKNPDGTKAFDGKPGKFTVTASGTTNGDGILREATLAQCLPAGSAQCDGVCSGALCVLSTAPLFPTIALKVRPFLWLHVICMLVSWGCLLPLGVLWAHNMRWSDKKLCNTPIWFQGHRILQTIGWLFQLLGFIFIFLEKGGFGMVGGHFKTPHEIIGLIVVVIGTLQPFNALLRHLPFIGHLSEDGSRSCGRLAWEITHKGLGYIAVLLGAINIILGISYANMIGFVGGLVPLAITFAALSLGTQLLTCCAAEAYRAVTKYKQIEMVPTSDEDSEEAGPE